MRKFPYFNSVIIIVMMLSIIPLLLVSNVGNISSSIVIYADNGSVPDLQINPNSGAGGILITAIISGFNPDHITTIFIDDSPVFSCLLGNCQKEFDSVFTWPIGAHTITASNGLG